KAGRRSCGSPAQRPRPPSQSKRHCYKRRTHGSRSPRFSFGKKEFECELKQIQSLRDQLAHANDYASSARAASETCKTVRLIDNWSRQLLQAFHGGRG